MELNTKLNDLPGDVALRQLPRFLTAVIAGASTRVETENGWQVFVPDDLSLDVADIRGDSALWQGQHEGQYGLIYNFEYADPALIEAGLYDAGSDSEPDTFLRELFGSI